MMKLPILPCAEILESYFCLPHQKHEITPTKTADTDWLITNNNNNNTGKAGIVSRHCYNDFTEVTQHTLLVFVLCRSTNAGW